MPSTLKKNGLLFLGDGEQKVNFITTQDTALFVACLMDLERWSPASFIKGDYKTFNEILKLAENVRCEYTFV